MNLDSWIVNGSVGISSKTMWACIKNIEIDNADIPYDPDDFSRCYKLAKNCKISKDQLNIVAKKLPFWKPYIDNWDKLCELYEENLRTKWKKHKEIGMYDFMQKLRKQSDIIRYGR